MSDLDEIRELKEVLKTDSSNFQARRKLAILLLDNGFEDESLKQLLFLIGIFPNDSNLYFNLGIVYEKTKRLELAVQAYQKAIGINPEETDYYYNLGLTYIDLGEFDKAITAFEKVISIDTKDANSYFNLGLCYTKKNDVIEAINYFTQTIELNPHDVFAHFYLANHFKALGQTEIAVEEYKKVIDISPDYSWAYYNLGAIDFEEANFDSAIKYLDKTIELNPKDIDAFKVYAKVLMKLNKLKQAQNLIEYAIKENREAYDLYYILGQIYKQQENFVGYEKALNIVLKNYKNISYSPKLVKEELNQFIKQRIKQ